MKILFTGGGTGGHIFPIIAVAREIRKISAIGEIDFSYIGPKDEFGEFLFSQEYIGVKTISAGKIRRCPGFKSFFQNFIDVLFKIPLGILQSFFYIFLLAPDVIFSKGGFGSIPAVIAGRLLGVPIFLHESDAAPGLSNRFLSLFSLEIFVSFPNTGFFPREKIILVGNPIRREILVGSEAKSKDFFKLSGEKPVILVLGGSQGSQRINDRILEILPEALKHFELIWQTGEKKFKETEEEAKTIMDKSQERNLHLFPFLKDEELKNAYAACDLVVSRAGSGSIFEIAAMAKPSILIPLPESAQNHQLKNGYAYGEKGAAIVLEETNFTPNFFLEKLKYLFSNPAELKKMGLAAKEFSRPLAAKIIAGYLLDYLRS